MSLFRRTETVPKSCYDEMVALVRERYEESVIQIEKLRQDLADTRKVLADVLGVLDQTTAPMMQGRLHMTEDEEDLHYLHEQKMITGDELVKKLDELGLNIDLR